MSDERIPEDVQQLLRNDVESLEQLQVLLLLGEAGEHRWPAGAVATALGLEEAVVATILERLCSVKLIVAVVDEKGTYFRYCSDANQLLERLLRTHQRERLALMTFMTKQAMERVRASALRTFSLVFVPARPQDG